MIVPGILMALALSFMMLLAMFIPRVGVFMSDRVVGLFRRLAEGPGEVSGSRGGDCHLFQTNFVVVRGAMWFVVHSILSVTTSVWFRAQLTGFPCSVGNHGGRAVLFWTPRKGGTKCR